MVHVITTAIYAFLLIMPLATCLWLLASVRTIGSKKPPLSEHAVTPVPTSALKQAEPDKSGSANLDKTSGTSALPVKRPTSRKPKPTPLSAKFHTISHEGSPAPSPLASNSSPQDLSPLTLPKSRRHSLGSDPTSRPSSILSSLPLRRRSNSYSDSKTQSSNQLHSLASTDEPSSKTSLRTSLKGIHNRILTAYLDLYFTYGSSFSDKTILDEIFTSQRQYLGILRSNGTIDEKAANICQKLIRDCENTLTSNVPVPDTQKNNALYNFYRGIGLLWMAIVLPSKKNPHTSDLSVEELAATFFQTLGSIQLRNHTTTLGSPGKPARNICLNAATTTLFENLSILCKSDSNAIKLVTPENIRWVYPKKINLATAKLLSLKYTKPDLADKMALQDLKSVVDNHFSGLSIQDQQTVWTQVNTEIIKEFNGHLSLESIKSTLKDLNENAKYVTIDHPDIGKLYTQVEMRQKYVFGVRQGTAQLLTKRYSINSHPTYAEIQHLLSNICRTKLFSSLYPNDQTTVLNQVETTLTEMYGTTLSCESLATTLQELRTHAHCINIACKDIDKLQSRLGIWAGSALPTKTSGPI